MAIWFFEVKLAERRRFLWVPYWYTQTLITFRLDLAEGVAADWILGGHPCPELLIEAFAS